MGLWVASVFTTCPLQPAYENPGGYRAGYYYLAVYDGFILCILRDDSAWVWLHRTALSLFITTGATAFIAYFNYTLSRATIALQGAAEKQAKDTRTSLRIAVRAANAARRSADIADKSLLAANRPLLIIAPLELSHGDEIQPKPHVHFGLRNSGKGVSIVNRVGVTIQTFVPRALTLTQTTAFSDTSDFNGAIEPGETVVGNRVTSGVLTEETIMPIRRGELSLFFALEIVSQDIFHNPYTQKFPFIFDHVKGKFVRNRVFTEEKKKSE